MTWHAVTCWPWGGDVAEDRILCVGDGIVTDIRGALGEGLDSLYITGGLAAEATGTVIDPDPEMLADHLAAEGMQPDFAIGFLR